MAAYAHRMVHFIDGGIAKDVVNQNPVTAAPVPISPEDTT
jgi:putative ABC transport system ATP-binding protein